MTGRRNNIENQLMTKYMRLCKVKILPKRVKIKMNLTDMKNNGENYERLSWVADKR